ncbi:MAG: hypothetical protein Q7R83_00590 [bacterium]|nr:hypothetical protein [bacterium]
MNESARRAITRLRNGNIGVCIAATLACILGGAFLKDYTAGAVCFVAGALIVGGIVSRGVFSLVAHLRNKPYNHIDNLTTSIDMTASVLGTLSVLLFAYFVFPRPGQARGQISLIASSVAFLVFAVFLYGFRRRAVRLSDDIVEIVGNMNDNLLVTAGVEFVVNTGILFVADQLLKQLLNVAVITHWGQGTILAAALLLVLISTFLRWAKRV